MTIKVYEPYLPKEVLKYAHEALDSKILSHQSKYINLVAEKLQEALGVKHALLLNNGTSACHLMMKSLTKKLNKNGLKKLIVPNNCFIAPINSALYDKEFKLILVKTDINTWNIDLLDLDNKIKKHPDAAVLIVGNIGNVINVPKLQIKYKNTVFVEDNCETFLGKYEGAYTGTKSYCSTISFFANKIIAAPESGCLLTNDDGAYEYSKLLHSNAQKERFVHYDIAYNYRSCGVNAALIYGQLIILDRILEMKFNVFKRYQDAFFDREDILMQKNEDKTVSAPWMFGIRIHGSNYKEAEKFFADKGIEIRQMFFPLTRHPYLHNNKYIKLIQDRNAEVLNDECIILPSYPELTIKEQGFIIDTVNEYIKNIKGNK